MYVCVRGVDFGIVAIVWYLYYYFVYYYTVTDLHNNTDQFVFIEHNFLLQGLKAYSRIQ